MVSKSQCSKIGESWKSPFSKLRSVPVRGSRWTVGFWAEEFEKCYKIMIPAMHDALLNPVNAASLLNIAVAAGLKEGSYLGAPWSDADCYKFIQAMNYIYSITNDEELEKIIDRYIAEISMAQEKDGYISTSIQLNSHKSRWQNDQYLELYNMGHLMSAACVHFRITGKDSFLNIAIKVGDLLYNLYKSDPKRFANFDICPANIMGAIDLYRTTSTAKYLELALMFIDLRGSATGGSDCNQTRTPLREEGEAVGHAVEAAYLYSGAADVYAETGEIALFDTLERLWTNMTTKKMYITGGIGAWHHGVSAHWIPGVMHIKDLVTEALGKEYELPNRTAYNETCASTVSAMFNYRMLNITAEAKYADEMERIVYNYMLASKDIEGKQFFYTNPLARANKNIPLLMQDSEKRWSTWNCYCCPPNLARTIAGLHEWAYGISEDGIWVHMYGGSELSTEIPGKGHVKLKEETRYPWDGDVAFTILEAPLSAFAIMLRIPGWSDGGEIAINGKPLQIKAEPGSYAVVERAWQIGDVIRVRLPMRVKVMRAHPLVEEARGRVCITRGPIVYCLESKDLPEGIGLDEVYLPAKPEFTTMHDDTLLGGMTVLEGKAFRVDGTNWDGRLYQEASLPQAGMVPVILIPYYAWCNRGESEMTVWIPVI